MAVPTCQGLSGARRERNSNKHKRLFLPNESDALKVVPQYRHPSPFVYMRDQLSLGRILQLNAF